MKKTSLLLVLVVAIMAISCNKKSEDEVTPQITEEQEFKITDLERSIWVLKGYFKDGAYIKTHQDVCNCTENVGFVLNYQTDTIPYNEGKFHSYLLLEDGQDNQGMFWHPVDSIFNGWPSGKSDYFQEYTIISINKDSIVVDDGTPYSADGSYSVYINRSDLLK